MGAQIGAIFAGVVLEPELEALGLEDAGVIGEQAEEDADHETLQVVAGVRKTSFGRR